MRPGFANPLGMARSMNSVGRLVQIDPDQADRVVGTRRDCEFPIGSHAFELELRVVVIGGVFDNPANAVSTAWCRLLAAAHRCPIEGDQFIITPKCTNGAGRLVDLDPEHLPGGPAVGDVGNGYHRPGAINGLAGVEQLEQLLAGMEFFRQKLRRAPVAELAEAGHALKIAGYFGHKWPANIIVRDRVGDQGRRVRGFAKFGENAEFGIYARMPSPGKCRAMPLRP
jgi:hypothetical protein